MLWVLGGAEVEPYTGFGSSLYIPAFVEFIWGKRMEWVHLASWSIWGLILVQT